MEHFDKKKVVLHPKKLQIIFFGPDLTDLQFLKQMVDVLKS